MSNDKRDPEYRVGVVGQGFVGGAIARAFRTVRGVSVSTYDKYLHDRSTGTLEDIVGGADVIFVCVPSPANDDGTCDTSIVEEVVLEISDIAARFDVRPIVVIKSTIPPGTTDALAVRCMKGKRRVIDLFFNPEFLNARSAYEDYVNQTHVVLGWSQDAVGNAELAELHGMLLPSATIEIVDARTAETIKYVKNCFFGVKVSFANEAYQICQKLGVDYDEMIRIAKLDDRMGWEHWKVPGPSPGAGPCAEKLMFGFGGVCIVKDVNAFRQVARKLGVDPKMMDAAWEKNLEVRPERDWEYLSGAVKNPKSLQRELFEDVK